MNLLALDSATEHLALALVAREGIHPVNLPGGAAASVRIVPEALALLAAHGLTLTDLDALAVGQGPGAFTGLRTAIAVAQGLALGAALPVVRVDSLAIVADDARAQQPAATHVQVAQDARMGQLYAGRYVWQNEAWHTEEAPGLWDVADLQARPAEGWLWAGSGLPLLGQAGVATLHDRAAALGRLARAGWLAGQAQAAEAALPVYVRDKVALTTAERVRA